MTLKEKAAAEVSKEQSLVIPVLYLDLDGTVRKGFDELGKFVNGPVDVEVFPEALRAMRRFKKLGYRIVAVTNQGGVALGHISMEDMIGALAETQKQCDNLFDIMMACRHHPDAKDPLMATCWCRKPRIGLVVEAALRLSAQFNGMCPPSAALFVGDRPEDRQCAENAGIKFMDAREWRDRYGSSTDSAVFEL